MKTLILLRGLPGAGKSTIARLLVGDKDYCHKEADMYFVDRVGIYNFDGSKIKLAHDWCREEVEFVMRHEHPTVVVSNTFTQEWEMEAYYELAKKYDYRVSTLVVENRHGGKNVHNVPDEVLDKMEARFEVKLK